MNVSVDLSIFKYKEFSEKKECDEVGRFGKVYVATHRYLHNVALRLISQGPVRRPSDCDSLLQEAKKLFGITSEHVVRLHGIVMDEVLGLVYEYAEFGPLDKLFIRHKMQWPLKIRISHQIALGMDFLHSNNIMHLRLKSRNILIKGDIQVKISDIFFYHCREMRTWSAIASQTTAADPHSHTGSSTVAHIPPERSRNINLTPEKSWDVYAYGIILWEIMTGKIPYENETEICHKVAGGLRPNRTSIPHDRPGEMNQLMEECWETNRDRRPRFKDITQRLTILLKPVENEARDQALKCQEDIKEYFFNEGVFKPPSGDIYDSSSRRPRNSSETSASTRETTTPREHEASFSRATSDEGNGFAISTQAIVELPEPKNSATPVWVDVDNSSRRVNTNDLYVVAGCIETNYYDFGKNVLKLTDNDIDIIEEQYLDNSLEIAYQMLRRWKEDSKITLTVSYLVKVLKTTGYSRVVDHLHP